MISAPSSKNSDNQESGDFNFKECLKDIRQNNLNRPILGQLNINSIRNKFSFLASQIGNNLDALLISETKLDGTSPTAQFLLDGFKKPYRLDRCSKGGGLLLFVRDDISSRLLTEYKTPTNVECIFIEISIRKKNWLLCCSYNPHKSNISTHMHHLSKGLDIYMNKYDNILFLGDFNSETSENYLNDFCNVYNLRNIVKEPICFKNPENPSCIDLFLTNRPRCFQNTVAVETGISDFHKMVVTVLKVFYKKQKPKIIQYRKYDNFNNDLFREELNNELLNVDLNNAELSEFTETFMSLLDKHAPKKQKYIRANNANFMTKSLRKAIMLRSKFRNRFLKEKAEESKSLYNKQINICVSLLRKTKRNYYAQLDNIIVTDTRKFGKQ